MEKRKTYWDVRLIPDAINELENHIQASGLSNTDNYPSFSVRLQGYESWSFDTFDEFIAEYPRALEATYIRTGKEFRFSVHVDNVQDGIYTSVSVSSKDRQIIHRLFNIAEKYVDRSAVPAPLPNKTKRPKVFIGHGRSEEWRDLKDHLHDKHGYEVVAFEVGERAGHQIRDILQDMLHKSAIAFLVFTGEDETAEGKMHVRQNVVHEAGLFQGRLGFARGIILREEGAEDFSNIAGIQQIRFSKGNIREVFGDVLSVLKREFGT